MAGKKDVTAYKRPHKLKYGKWGLIFILPFFICYGIFQYISVNCNILSKLFS